MDYPIDRNVVRAAARNGHINMLKWLVNEGYDIFHEDLYWSAAQGGHIDVMKWARDNDCPWSTDLCAEAADNGHLGVIKWARRNGCPWDSDTRYFAQKFAQMHQGGSELLRWVIEQKCPISNMPKERRRNDHSVLARTGHRDIALV